MLRRRASVSTGIVLSLCVMGGLAWSLRGAQAKPNTAVETLHPGKPVFLYVFDGLTAHQKTWDATAAKKSLVDSGLAVQLNKLLAYLVSKTGDKGAELAHQIFLQLLEKGASISVAVDTANPLPAPQATIILHGSASFEKDLNALLLAGVLKELNPKTETIGGRKVTRVVIPDTPGVEVGWWSDGGHLVIAGGIKGIEGALAVAQGKAPNLTTNAMAQKLRTSKDFEVVSIGMLDLKTVLGLARNIPLPETAPGKGGKTVGDILKIAGLDGLGVLSGRWGFKAEAILSDTTLQAKAPFSGFMALFDQKPLTIADMPAIPANCEHFSLMRLDGSKLYDSLLKMAQDVAEKFAPEDAPPLDQMIFQVNEAIGFDLKKDLFDPLGDTVVYYAESAGLFPTVTLLVKLDDANKIKESLGKLEDQIITIAGQELRGNVQFRTKDFAGGRKIHIAQISGQAFFSPTWVVDGDWLVLSTTAQSVESYLKRVDGKLSKWKPSPDLLAAQKLMPNKFQSLSYSDPRNGIRSALGLAPTGIAALEMALTQMGRIVEPGGQAAEPSAAFPIAPEDVPLADEVAEPLFANVSISSIDAEGIHWYTRNSIPGLPIPGLPGGSGGVETVGVVAIVAALLVPATGQAREAARRVQSMNNLKQLGLALHNYHDTFNNLPQGTHENADLTKPEERLSWFVDILPFFDQAPLYNTILREEGFEAEGNKEALSANLPILIDPSQAPKPDPKGYGQTTYVGIAGIGKDAATLEIGDAKAGIFGYNRKTRFADVTDGLSNTMMVSDTYKDFGPWGQGGPSTIRSLTAKPYINGPDGLGRGKEAKGGLILLGDGSVRFVSEKVAPEILEALATMAGGEVVGDY
jgi:hypothetical protein